MNKKETSFAPLQLLGNKISYLHLENSLVAFQDHDASLKRNLDIEYSIDNISFDEEANLKVCTITLYTKISVTTESNLEIDLTVAVEGGFTIDGRLPDGEAEKYLSINGCASLYSITRAIILSVTAQATNGGKVILPMINTSNLNRRDPNNPIVKLI